MKDKVPHPPLLLTFFISICSGLRLAAKDYIDIFLLLALVPLYVLNFGLNVERPEARLGRSSEHKVGSVLGVILISPSLLVHFNIAHFSADSWARRSS